MTDLLCKFKVTRLDSLSLLAERNRLEEGNGLLLPEDAIVLLFEVHEGVAGLAMPDVWKTSLDTQAQMVTDHLQICSRVKDDNNHIW